MSYIGQENSFPEQAKRLMRPASARSERGGTPLIKPNKYQQKFIHISVPSQVYANTKCKPKSHFNLCLCAEL